MSIKKSLAAALIGAFVTISSAQSAIIFFPLGLLVFLHPVCESRPILCLALDAETTVEDKIYNTVSKKYSFLDEAALQTLSELVREELPADYDREKVYEVRLGEKTLKEEVLIPSGALDFYPEKSKKLIRDFN